MDRDGNPYTPVLDWGAWATLFAFFTTPHFDGHPSVLVRGSRIGELSVQELTEVIQDAWLFRASRARAAAWLSAHQVT